MSEGEVLLKRFLYVVNPISGDKAKEDILEDIETFSKKNSLEHKILKTTGQDDEKEIKSTISSFQAQVVVAVGGDGTVNLVAQLVAGTDLVLGIIPMGSGNGLSKDLNIPQNNIDRALNVLLQSNIKAIDTLTANGRFFMHLCDIGFNARIVKLFNKGKSRGLFTYMKFTLKEFFKYKTSYYYIKTDKDAFQGRAFMITVANSNQFGSNLMINPNGKYDDGIFEVIIIKRFPRKKALKLFLMLLFKRINFSPYCIILKCREANIRPKKKKSFQYDGEIAGEVDEVDIQIKHHNLNVMIP